MEFTNIKRCPVVTCITADASGDHADANGRRSPPRHPLGTELEPTINHSRFDSYRGHSASTWSGDFGGREPLNRPPTRYGVRFRTTCHGRGRAMLLPGHPPKDTPDANKDIGTTNGTRLQLYTCGGTTNQKRYTG